ncbi:hypothetical protein GGI20_005040 [Coemansia sp. BCRC 34301]|nr:hypothetical protein GGI20_005040 [Coemansia sp. BCRC 34301]
MFTTPLRQSIVRSFKRIQAAPLPRGPLMLAPTASTRAYTKIDIYTESEAQLNPIEFHKYLQSNKERELREFLTEESEMIASESFNVDRDIPSSSKIPASSPASKSGNKAVNEEFAKQIHDLLNPSYGTA